MDNKRPVRSRVRVRPGGGPPPSVDGHPGWVEQSVRQYGWLCAVSVMIQIMITGVGPVLLGARSAAWWVVLVGALLGGVLLWTPLWGLMRGGEQPRTLDEALVASLGPVAGRALPLLYVLLLLMDAGVALRTVGSLVRRHMISYGNETLASVATLAALFTALCAYGGKGLSRTAWLFRIPFAVMVAGTVLTMSQNAELSNLFPVLGQSVPETLAQLPTSAGSVTGLLLLGLLPRETGSARPIPLRTGLWPLALGALLAALYMLFINLSIGPRAISEDITLDVRLILAIQYVRRLYAYRIFFLFSITLLLALSAGTGIAVGSMLVQSSLQAQRLRWPVLGVCAAMLLFLLTVRRGAQALVNQVFPWRLPIAALPLWLAWGVDALRRPQAKKEEKA